MLRSVSWFLFTDLLGQPSCFIFKCQAVEDSLTFEDGTDKLSRNVGKPTLPNILEE